jgi:hypothetical protein
MRIETGAAESHEAVLPLNPAASPGVQGPTAVAGQLTPADQTPARDLTSERLGLLAASAAECAAAQSYGQSADGSRRQHYLAGMAPLGASAGDQMVLPPVPDNALPPALSDLYPYAGMEPTAAAAGWDYNADLPG